MNSQSNPILNISLLFITVSDCINDEQGKNYIGSQNVTRSGITCQRWSSQLPHAHNYNNTMFFVDPQLPENFCRNPSGDNRGLWCYTTDPLMRRDYCDVQYCCKSLSLCIVRKTAVNCLVLCCTVILW